MYSTDSCMNIYTSVVYMYTKISIYVYMPFNCTTQVKLNMYVCVVNIL